MPKKNLLLRIEHPKTGEAYGVSRKTFEKTYEERGFRVVGYEDGSPLEEKATKAEKAGETKLVEPAGPVGG